MVKFRESYGAAKGARHQKVEEPPGTPRRGAWSIDLEESASHQFQASLGITRDHLEGSLMFLDAPG